MELIDTALYRGEPGLAYWCAETKAFLDTEGNPIPDFKPEELCVSKYFVHRYDVVRIKVAIEARSHLEAMQKADEYLAKEHPLRDLQHDVGEPEKIAKHYGFPTWIETAHAEEVTGYLVDELGDEEYDRSASYDRSFNLHYPTWGEHPDHTLAGWQYEVENDDTRLGYWDWVAGQKELINT